MMKHILVSAALLSTPLMASTNQVHQEPIDGNSIIAQHRQFNGMIDVTPLEEIKVGLEKDEAMTAYPGLSTHGTHAEIVHALGFLIEAAKTSTFTEITTEPLTDGVTKSDFRRFMDQAKEVPFKVVAFGNGFVEREALSGSYAGLTLADLIESSENGQTEVLLNSGQATTVQDLVSDRLNFDDNAIGTDFVDTYKTEYMTKVSAIYFDTLARQTELFGEVKADLRSYLPVVGDSAETIEQKRVKRENVLSGTEAKTFDALKELGKLGRMLAAI